MFGKAQTERQNAGLFQAKTGVTRVRDYGMPSHQYFRNETTGIGASFSRP